MGTGWHLKLVFSGKKSRLKRLFAVCSEKAVIETSSVAFWRVRALQLYREWPNNLAWLGVVFWSPGPLARARPQSLWGISIVCKCGMKFVSENCSSLNGMQMGLPSRLAIYFALVDCESRVQGQTIAVDSVFSPVTLSLFIPSMAWLSSCVQHFLKAFSALCIFF